MQAKKVLQQLARLRLDVNTVFDRAISDCERSDVNETVPMLPDRLRQLEDIGRALGLSQTDFFDPTPGSTAVQKGDEWIASLMTYAICISDPEAQQLLLSIVRFIAQHPEVR